MNRSGQGLTAEEQASAKRAGRVVLDRGGASTMVPNVDWRRVPSVAAGKPDY